MPAPDAALPGARPLRLILRITALALFVGASLLPAPRLARGAWPWPLTPWDARLLGATYLTALVAIVLLLIVERWALFRLLSPTVITFGAVISLASLLHLDRFDLQRWTTWAWFILSLVPLLALTYHLRFYRRWRPAEVAPLPAPWRIYLTAQGLTLGLYGLGLFLAPTAFGALWPWPVDAFHGRLYSAPFLAGAVGSLILAQAAAPVEVAALGLLQSLCGLPTILIGGLAATSQGSAPWLWLGGLATLSLAGLATLRRARATLPTLWERWQAAARAIGDFQARLLLTLFYFVIVTPFGLAVRLFSDPLRLRRPQADSAWIARTSSDGDMDRARSQF